MDAEPDELIAEADYVAWANTLQQLEDARVHLDKLIEQMQADNGICVIDFGVQLGHIYGHLNRTWNGKHIAGGNPDEWHTDENSRFPEDLMIT